MKFRVKQWEKKWNGRKYKDVFNDIGVFDVQMGGSGDGKFATLKRGNKTLTITGTFVFEVEEKYLNFNGFIQEDELRYVQYRCYND